MLIRETNHQVAVDKIVEELKGGRCADVIYEGEDLVFTPPLDDQAILVARGPDDSEERTYQRFLRGGLSVSHVQEKIGADRDLAKLVCDVIDRV